MRRLLLALFFLCFAVVADIAHAATTYVYTGPNYAQTTGVYATSMKITGSFTTASPLAANLTDAQIGPGGLNLVTQWSFSDGVHTLTNLDSALFAGNPSFFSVSTDTSGNITAFLIGLMNPTGTNTVGQAMDVVVFYSDSPYQEVVAGAPCAFLASGKCAAINPGTNRATGGSARGIFAIAAAVPTASAPMLAPCLLALLTLVLLVFAYRARLDR